MGLSTICQGTWKGVLSTYALGHILRGLCTSRGHHSSLWPGFRPSQLQSKSTWKILTWIFTHRWAFVEIQVSRNVPELQERKKKMTMNFNALDCVRGIVWLNPHYPSSKQNNLGQDENLFSHGESFFYHGEKKEWVSEHSASSAAQLAAREIHFSLTASRVLNHKFHAGRKGD